MLKYDDAEIQDVKYDAAIHRGNVEWAQRGLVHRHILPYHVIQELRAAAELRDRVQVEPPERVWVEPYVERPQRGLIHRHILPYNVIQELQAAAELRARQHAESVMRPKWTRVCATRRWRRTVAQRHKVRWWTCARLRINHAHLRHTC